MEFLKISRLRLLFLSTVLCLCNVVSSNDFVWFNGSAPISYSVPQKTSNVVKIAIGMFRGDMKQVTGMEPLQKSTDLATIDIIELDSADYKTKEYLRNINIPVDELTSRRDGFHISVSPRKNQLVVVGNNGRGTAYGILELSRLAGVSPWVWWSDVTPQKQDKLTVSDDYKTFQSPSVEYRGIFINDEDWSLQPWSWKTFEPTDVKGRIGARTYKEIFKLLLRLRANAIWPAMHGITTPFYMVPGAKEVADSCGIAIGTSHCEPLLRNNVGEWDAKRRGAFNYVTNRDSVKSYWTERLKEAGRFENIYTIGMRGIHDGAMEGVKTMREKTSTLQQVIDDQRRLLTQYVNKDLRMIPQVFLPYKEVLQIMENGIKVPDDVTLMWCDDNYGYMTRLSNAEQQKRSGGSGVYYHLSYWGRPHDYLWLTTIQPGLIYSEMKQAYDHNARRVWIVNVHDLKPSAFDLELFLDMAWDINMITPSTLNSYQEKWLCREFGNEAGKKLQPAMLEYYKLCGIRKPELMGWNQIELDKKKFDKGWSPVEDTEFSLTEFGNELDRYLDGYKKIESIVAETENIIPASRKDAYFSHIKYPMSAAADMSIKMLEAQRARYYSEKGGKSQSKEKLIRSACAKSLKAYQDINELTYYYNNKMSGGKWRYSMSCSPRDLYVFNAPNLPLKLNKEEIDKYAIDDNTANAASQNIKGDDFVAFNAKDYAKASQGTEIIQQLGHSMNAVSLPKGGTLTYEFNCPFSGEALLRTAVIPTQSNDKVDIRFSVSIDNEKPQIVSFLENGRTEGWKKNVSRGQAVKTTKHTIKKGKHTLNITALDDHVIIDQWMLDAKADRKFYMFPIND